jgi:ligand-binding SRPBCC domain-containing protein
VSGYRLTRRQRVARPPGEVFTFFADPENLALITPPWLRFRLIAYQPPGTSELRDPAAAGSRRPRITMAQGLRLHYTIRPLGVPQRWVSAVTEWDPPHRFVDEQLRGPYRRWRHAHDFAAVSGGTEVSDVVDYDVGYGPFGAAAHALLVRRRLEAIFAFRQRAIDRIFTATEESR